MGFKGCQLPRCVSIRSWSETNVSNPNTSFFVHATPPLVNSNWASLWENRLFAYAKTKAQISFAVTAKLISAFVFATWIVQSLYFLNLKFQASDHCLWLYRPVCVGPRWKPYRPVFSGRGSTDSRSYFWNLFHFIQVGKRDKVRILWYLMMIKWGDSNEHPQHRIFYGEISKIFP